MVAVGSPDGEGARLTDKARATRAALVRSATELFVERGYGSVSVRDLARRTDLTSGAIYGHFRNKADLLVAAIADRIASDLEAPRYGRIGVAKYMARQWRAYRSRAGMRALIVEGAAAARVDPDIRRELGALHDAKLREWRTIWHEIQRDEGLDPEIDVDTLVVFLWAAELGVGVLESLGVGLPKPTSWERLIERLLGSLVVRPRKRR